MARIYRDTSLGISVSKLDFNPNTYFAEVLALLTTVTQK